MGYYINPPDTSKESWLQEHAVQVSEPKWPADPAMALVCLIDNGPFRAAGICYSKEEMEAFAAPDLIARHQRPRSWWLAPKAKLYAVSDIKEETWR